MGTCSSSKIQSSNDTLTANSHKIDAALENERLRQTNRCRILLLGIGEAGKSTFFKQVLRAHTKIGMNEIARDEVFEIIQQNAHECIVKLLQMVELESPEDNAAKATILAIATNPTAQMTVDIAQSMQRLFNRKPVQDVYTNRNDLKFYIMDNAAYYMDRCVTLVENGKLAVSNEDWFMARKRTTGITQCSFVVGPITYDLVDVGGQRSERKKWLSCFDNMDAIVYVTNAAGFTTRMFEDETVNMMSEALTVLQETANHRALAKVPFFLFLNKQDLFCDVMAKASAITALRQVFPDFRRTADNDSVLSFIEQKFRNVMPSTNALAATLIGSAKNRQSVDAIWLSITSVLDAHRTGRPRTAKRDPSMEIESKMFSTTDTTSPLNSDSSPSRTMAFQLPSPDSKHDARASYVFTSHPHSLGSVNNA
jgi:GTPase SAR1 family protein